MKISNLLIISAFMFLFLFLTIDLFSVKKHLQLKKQEIETVENNETHTLEDFDHITVSGPLVLHITQAATNSYKFLSKETTLPKYSAAENTLFITGKKEDILELSITHVSKITALDSAFVTLKNYQSPTLQLEASESSSFSLGLVEVDYLKLIGNQAQFSSGDLNPKLIRHTRIAPIEPIDFANSYRISVIDIDGQDTKIRFSNISCDTIKGKLDETSTLELKGAKILKIDKSEEKFLLIQ